MAAQVSQIKGTYVDATDSNCAALDVVNPKQQIHQRCLACACVTDNRDGLGRLNTEADVLQYPFFVVVSEPDTIELDIDWPIRKRRRGVWRNDARSCIHQFENSFRGGHRALQDVVFFA